ncbi:TPA: DUF2057 family protein [Enterobacter cancerogenus]|nr:DUF2057 family protein [Enterobacter cancerogenus]HBI6867555.1 DUF2057 family protein [Enterobacter cancerogenus]
MKRFVLVMPLFCTSLAFAGTLEFGDNVVALAASKSKVSIFSKSIKLADGDNSLVVNFDSQANPESVNQGKGRITSAPYIITFNYSGNDTVFLSTAKVSDENEAKKQAANPSFTLTANNIPVDFKVKKIDQDSVNIFSDYKSLLNTEEKNLSPESTSTSENNGSLQDAINVYNKLTDKQKIIFMKWLLKN